MRTSMSVLLSAGLMLLSVGCAERKMTVISDPPGAVVFLDGVEKGVTPTTFKFNWYGDRRFVLQRDGCKIHEEIRQVRAPLHMRFPLDAIWDLTPLPASDHKTFHFTLTEETGTDLDQLKARGEAMRRRLYGQPEPEPGRPESAEPPPSTESTSGEPESTAEPAPTTPETAPQTPPEPTETAPETPPGPP